MNKKIAKTTAVEQRRDNAKIVLQVIRSHKGINRKQIADITGLSVPSVTKIVAFLIELQLLESHEGKGVTNKTIPFYYFDPSCYAVVGVDLGRTSASCMLCDLNGKVHSRVEYEYEGNAEKVRRTMVSRLKRLIARSEDDGVPVLVVGFGTPGPINVRTKRTLNVKNYDYWTQFCVGDYFQEQLNRPVVLEFGVDMMLYAEKTHGVGRGKENLLCFYVSNGIGCSILYQGKIFRPNPVVYHSLGHLTVDPDGPECICGNNGCLELYCSRKALEDRISDSASVMERELVLNRAADKFCVAVRNVMTLMGIEDIVLGGGVIKKFPEFYNLVREKLMIQKYVSGNMPPNVMQAEISESPVAQGIAVYLADNILGSLHVKSGEQKSSLVFG